MSRPMFCKLSAMPGCAAEHSVLCAPCSRERANRVKAGWIINGNEFNEGELIRCDGNPALRCIACGYHSGAAAASPDAPKGASLPPDPSARAQSRDRLWDVRSQVDAATDAERLKLGEVSRKYAQAALTQKGARANLIMDDVRMAQLLLGLKLLCEDTGIVFEDVNLTANFMCNRVEDAEKESKRHG